MRLFSNSASIIDDPYLARAYELALRGRGRTAPNPMVGCVIVSNGRVIGEGSHPGAGQPHAEVFALREAGDAARGASAYVTLEPCAHHGRTPPCADALIEAGVVQVVIGMPDPSPTASGGAARLTDAGIQVRFAENPAPYQELNEGWLKRVRTGIPFVTVKSAVSLDGRISLRRGECTSITGTAGARVTSTLRSAVDAVIVGASTVSADDPALTVRDADGVLAAVQPLRVVLCRSRVLAKQSKVFADGLAETLVLVPEESGALEQRIYDPGVSIVEYEPEAGLSGVVALLGERGLNDVLFEPGSRLLASLWEESLIDRLITVTAGGMAGADAQPMYGGQADAEADRLIHVMEPEEAGIVDDIAVVSWRPAGSRQNSVVKGSECSRD